MNENVPCQNGEKLDLTQNVDLPAKMNGWALSQTFLKVLNFNFEKVQML